MQNTRDDFTSGELANRLLPALPQYELHELISAGHAAYIWRGRIRTSGEQVIVKVATAARRYNDRAIAVTRLDHRNLVRVHDHGELADGRSYAVLEHVEGDRLRRFMIGAMQPDDVRMILKQLARGLAFAHADGVAHGAVTPEHVLLAEANDPDAWCTVRLLGLGTSSTHDVHYAAPEQLAGGDPNERCDVFSLAAIAVEMLTGEPIYAIRNVLALGRRPQLRRKLSLIEELRPVLEAALHTEPTRRPNLVELALALTGESLDQFARGSGLISAT